MKSMDSFLTLAAKRYSVRSFDPRPLEEETINKIIKAAYIAPSACNFQPVHILVLNAPAALEKLPACTPCHFNAPAVFVVCYDKTECWKRGFDGKTSGDIDGAIAATHMILEAAELGVGSTWVMYFDPAALRQQYAIPENLEPVALLPMGYPAQDAAPNKNHETFRPLNEMVSYNEF